jgi:hypothetical protein
VPERPARRRRRLPLLLILGTLLSALVAGCTSIPTSGPVKSGPEVRAGDDAVAPVIYQPDPPLPGGTREQIVEGFLSAVSTYDDGHAVARQFLAPEIAQDWRPEPRVVVYTAKRTLAPAERSQVSLVFEQVAAIDGGGRYTEFARPREVSAHFTLRSVDGEWRISGLDDGVFVTRDFLRSTFRHVNLYFLSPNRQTVVPDPVLLPRRQGMATALTERLLEGPGARLQPAVTTAFPAETSLALSVQVSDGVAQVDLNEAALSASTTERQAMAAQLVWTLRQLEEVDAVRMTVGDEPLVIGGGREGAQGLEAWSGLDPNVLAATDPYFVQEGVLVEQQANGSVEPAPGWFDDGGLELRLPAISPEASHVALLSPDRTRLFVGDLISGAAPSERRLQGTALTRGSWDRDGRVWLADAGTGQVWVVDLGGGVQEVGLPEIDGARIQAVRLSPDGVRIAAIVQVGARLQLRVGAVVRPAGGPPRIENLVRIAPSLTELRDIGWTADDQLAVLGRDASRPLQPLLVDVDGFTVVGTVQRPDAETLATAPGQPLIVGVASGEIYELSVRQWQLLGVGVDPVYPG